MEYFMLLYRVFVIVFYIFTLWYDVNFIGMRFNPEANEMNFFMEGRLYLLTVWNMIGIIIFQAVALANDFYGTNQISPIKRPNIRKVRDYLFTVITFPLSMFVGTTFWLIYAADRELIFPKRLDGHFDSWVNHTRHTLIILIVFLEMFSNFRRYPRTRYAIIGITTVIISYMSLIFTLKFLVDYWMYPVLGALNNLQRIIFILGIICYGFILYLVGKFINNKYWAKELRVCDSKC